MRFIIVGVGKVGRRLTELLISEGHDIVVIDTNSHLIEEIVDTYDVLGVVGNGASYEILTEAEASKADVIIACTELDELNILSCLIGMKIGIKHTIARVRNPEYSKQINFLNRELGLSLIVNPEYEAANEILKTLQFPSAENIETFANGRVEIVEVVVKSDSILKNHSLSELRSIIKTKFLVSTIMRDGKAYIPDGKFVVQENDHVLFIGSKREIANLFKELGIFKMRAKNVMLIGGGFISYYLARQLQEVNCKVKIIELDRNRCHELKELLPNVSVVMGDGSNQELLIEEGLHDVDAVVTLTGLDEENIILSLFAQQEKVPKIITKVNKYEYFDILESLGLASVISPKSVAANNILRYIRSIENAIDSKVETLYKLVNDQVEALEFIINQVSEITNIKFKDLKFKANTLVASIIRNNNVIIPNGEDCFMPLDRVIIVTQNRNINDIGDLII